MDCPEHKCLELAYCPKCLSEHWKRLYETQVSEITALKEQVAQLVRAHGADKEVIDSLKVQRNSLQSKSAALVDALETYFKQYPHMMKGYILDALAAFKGEK